LIGWTSDANGRCASSRVFSAKSVCPDKCSRTRAPRLIAAALLPVNPLFCNREAVHSRCPDDCVLQIFRFWLAAVRSSVVLRRDALSHRDKAQQISLTSISVLLLKDHSQVSDTLLKATALYHTCVCPAFTCHAFDRLYRGYHRIISFCTETIRLLDACESLHGQGPFQ
jgi:hypothetical protein